ncbi:Putative zinc metalloprotease Rip3 (plasmid) [Pseudoseohaeicola sp. NH-UV-7]|uniref:site-2 protease family protein n=1 Tax=Sulfitobacter sp. TBRI5 TaxID=2989732 RepID=UPI003A5FA2CA
MFSGSRKILSLFGFEVKIDPSWFLIAALITWSLATGVFPTSLPGASENMYFLMALIAMLLFFASLVLHELAHALVARSFGIKITGITLFVFGGVAELAEEPPTPRSEFFTALAGPVMSIALSLGFWLMGTALSELGFAGPATAVLEYLALINLVLALFNLLPAFPLDGGRLLRALLWHRSGNLLDATRIASRSGEILAYALMGLGFLSVFSGALIGGIWQIVIGLFILAAAKSSYQKQMMTKIMSGQKVSDLMTRNVFKVTPDSTLANLVDNIMLAHRVSFVPVVENGAVLGYVDLQTVLRIDHDNWQSTHVNDLFIVQDDSNRVSPDMTAKDLLDLMNRTNTRKFLVTEGGKLRGVVSMSDMINYFALSMQVASQPGSNAAQKHRPVKTTKRRTRDQASAERLTSHARE